MNYIDFECFTFGSVSSSLTMALLSIVSKSSLNFIQGMSILRLPLN